ncbi:MAG: DEAD/DEAH box helicase [Candidatus Hydrogenedentota bacterium]|nr:MAG: DEAD/DEAH box helicase [Candidatus Hydrogenedentota bacterium]
MIAANTGTMKRKKQRNGKNEFEDLGLPTEILDALRERGYERPTPIQAAAIPMALAGRDLLGSAQTGTGKTAAYGIPILERLRATTFAHDPRALVLTPTRELAQQVGEFLEAYGKNLKCRVVVVVGGASMRRQISLLKAGCDLVVATPGRFLDLYRQRALQLGRIEIAVLDEADRMLDMGFIPDVRRIMRSLPRRRQTLLFSATLVPEVERLARDFLIDPVRVEVAPPVTPAEKIEQILCPVDFQYKEMLLDHIVRSETTDQVLIFTGTKRAADAVERYLRRKGHSVRVIHGDCSQSVRNRALRDFRSGRIRVLVATDVASRGLDIEGISHVINFDLPETVEDYVHRIGRTARAEASGVALSLVGTKDLEKIRRIEETFGKRLERRVFAGFEPKTCDILLKEIGADRGRSRPGFVRRRRLLRKGR